MLPSILTSAVVATLAASGPLVVARAIRNASPAPNTFPNLKGCPTDAVYSCENTTTIANTCCSPTPGGLVLVTSFWDTYTSDKRQPLPANNWGIHGEPGHIRRHWGENKPSELS
jgi:ribonuclease T2